ncbi:hypothetical protein Bca52824_027981 [Brassica carinata]|uniref:RING-type E3 ubiquitin transferase n=1 Tax=Brassica carinata TaxID=52824 RepID=A0A8X7VBI6_BRACI|nr:hypothetical protein Bca52824_027981 [Brassica carinata]
METKSLKVEISAQVTPQGLSLGLLNSVLISQCREIQEFLVDESDDGNNITSLGSYPDSSSYPDMLSLLRFKDFEPTTVHQQIKTRQRPCLVPTYHRSDYLPQGPLLITVFLKLTKKEYFVAPFSSAPWTAKVEGSCAICPEEMSEESEQESLCQPPGCVHMFHEDCLTHWLNRHYSCPLRRQSTNPLTNKQSEALEMLGEGFK